MAKQRIQKKSLSSLSQTKKAIHLREIRKLNRVAREYELLLAQEEGLDISKLKSSRGKRRSERKKNKIQLKANSYGMTISNNTRKYMPKDEFERLSKKYKSWKTPTNEISLVEDTNKVSKWDRWRALAA